MTVYGATFVAKNITIPYGVEVLEEEAPEGKVWVRPVLYGSVTLAPDGVVVNRGNGFCFRIQDRLKRLARRDLLNVLQPAGEEGIPHPPPGLILMFGERDDYIRDFLQGWTSLSNILDA